MHSESPTVLQQLPAVSVPPGGTVAVDRWPSEIPLLCLVAVSAFWIWLALAFSIIGIVYAALLGIFFFFTHVAFVTYVRGSAVRLSERQFPELHARVVELSRRAGLAAPPDAYLMQAGGSLNALATKLFRSRMIVLFSDLLDACGDDEKARDMVIGHEIGHLKSRHLDFHWLLLPGYFVPFLGAAYSRACEFTCDRWGRALCGDAAGATRGLAVLAAGGKLGPKVDLAAYIEQRRDLDTGWLTLGRWLSGYPPLSKRVEVLRPDIATQPFLSTRGTMRAVAILVLIGLVPMAGMGFAAWKMSKVFRDIAALSNPGVGGSPFDAADESDAGEPILEGAELTAALATADLDLGRLETLLREEHAESGRVPEDDAELAELWERRRPGEAYPQDPFGGGPYSYYFYDDATPTVYSAGPDGETATDDDIDRRVPLG
jgi:Zn-dependent protease with chaperone function